MVAAVETIPETKLRGSRLGNSVLFPATVVKKSGPMNSEPGIWNTLIHKEAAEVNGGFDDGVNRKGAAATTTTVFTTTTRRHKDTTMERHASTKRRSQREMGDGRRGWPIVAAALHDG